jgi:hypothetical protein
MLKLGADYTKYLFRGRVLLQTSPVRPIEKRQEDWLQSFALIR